MGAISGANPLAIIAEFQNNADLVNYYDKGEVDGALLNKANANHGHEINDVTGLQTALNQKQATLVSGTNIKTLNGQHLTGSGNVALKTFNGQQVTGFGDITVDSGTKLMFEKSLFGGL